MKKLWRKADRQTVKVHNKTKSIERKGKRCEGKILQIKQNFYRENRQELQEVRVKARQCVKVHNIGEKIESNGKQWEVKVKYKVFLQFFFGRCPL